MRRALTCAIALLAAGLARPTLGAQQVRPRMPRGGGIPGAEFVIVATDHRFEAPHQVDAGLVNVRMFNRGREMHHVLFIKVDRMAPLSDLANKLRTSEWATWMHAYGGPEAVEPGGVSSASLVLEAGRYVIACVVASPATHRQHFMDGMIAELEVVRGPGSDEPQVLQNAEITVRMTEWAFTADAPLYAGRRTIRVQNDGRFEHHMLVVRLLPGHTLTQAAKWAEDSKGPVPFAAVGGTTGLGPGRKANVTVDLSPGEYVLLCTLYNPLSKKTHAAQGMVRALTVVN